MGTRAYYTPIAGSRELVTDRLSGDAAIAEIEALAPGSLKRFAYGGELLGAAVIRDAFAPIPLDAFDRLAPRLGAEEQAAYLHLIRLSFGNGRNYCRVGKRELTLRLAVSERHLNRLLDGLVRKGALRPVHRNNLGTLYRVALPAEILGESPGESVQMGRTSPLRAAASREVRRRLAELSDPGSAA